MRKGQTTIPFTVIEAATTMLILLTLAYGTQAETNEFVKQETVGLQVERVHNAALAVNSVPRGYLEIKMSGYGFKYESSNITMNYSGTRVTQRIEESMVSYDSISGPTDFKRINGTLCLRKVDSSSGKELQMSKGEC